MIQSSTALNGSGTGGYQGWQTSVGKAVMRLDPTGRTAGPIPAFGKMVHETALAAQGMANAYAPSFQTQGTVSADLAYKAAPQETKFGFSDIIDIINPLQHLPVIGTLYRKFTGDVIKPVGNIVGGAIFGGPVGAISSAVNVAFKESTGKDVAENVLSLAGFDVVPESPKKPEILYETASLPGTTLAVANLSLTSPPTGHKNFANNDGIRSDRWNS